MSDKEIKALTSEEIDAFIVALESTNDRTNCEYCLSHGAFSEAHYRMQTCNTFDALLCTDCYQPVYEMLTLRKEFYCTVCKGNCFNFYPI